MKDQQVQTATVAQNQGTCILQENVIIPTLFAFFLAYYANVFFLHLYCQVR